MVAGGVDVEVLKAHDCKLAEVLASIEGERKSANNHALDFLQRHGIE